MYNYFSEPEKEDYFEEHEGDSVDLEEYRIEVAGIAEPGPSVEVRNLFRKLYGEPPGSRGTNPYFAKYRRLRARLLPRNKSEQDSDYVVGIAEYKYWPRLKLGYIENVFVNAEMRQKGIGVKLVNFVIDYLCDKGSQHIYAFAVNPEGCSLLASAGFVNEPPENPADSWRRWFLYNTD